MFGEVGDGILIVFGEVDTGGPPLAKSVDVAARAAAEGSRFEFSYAADRKREFGFSGMEE